MEIAGAKHTLAAKYDLPLWRTDLRGDWGQPLRDLRSDIRAEARRCMQHFYLGLLGETVVLLIIAYLYLVQHQH